MFMSDRQLKDEAKSFIGFDKALKLKQYECLIAAMSGQAVFAICLLVYISKDKRLERHRV